MSYIQIAYRGGFLARSIRLDASRRSGGYPSYDVEIIGNRGSVRTILYRDMSYRIFTSENSPFHLSEKDGRLIFTADPNAPYITLDTLQQQGALINQWMSEWANLETDIPVREGLIWPLPTPESVLQYIADRQFLFWIAITDVPKFPIGALIGIDEDRLHLSQNGARFRLLLRGDKYGLQAEDGRYVTCWKVAGACRLILTNNRDDAIFFDANHATENAYALSYGNNHLTWGQWIFGFFRVENFGIEFSRNSERLARIIISDAQVSDTDIFRMGQYAVVTTPQGLYRDLNPLNVTANLPLGGANCNQNRWEGVIQSCYGRRIPYDDVIGGIQCTTLADFSEDIHCREWARANRGPELDKRLKTLCKNINPQDESIPEKERAICSCYYQDNIYYNEIRHQYLERHNDAEATRVANAIQRTNLLQCASGLCVQDGNISAELFYREGRSCDVCIQVASVNVEAEKISGDVRVVQNCTSVRGTFTWQDLIQRLIALGTFQVGVGGIYRHVIINSGATAIKLITSTPIGQTIVRQFSLLRVHPKDAQGNITITRDEWITNNVQYSREILEFFFEYIEQSKV